MNKIFTFIALLGVPLVYGADVESAGEQSALLATAIEPAGEQIVLQPLYDRFERMRKLGADTDVEMLRVLAARAQAMTISGEIHISSTDKIFFSGGNLPRYNLVCTQKFFERISRKTEGIVLCDKLSYGRYVMAKDMVMLLGAAAAQKRASRFEWKGYSYSSPMLGNPIEKNQPDPVIASEPKITIIVEKGDEGCCTVL